MSSPPASLPSISVVTPSYKQAEWLKLCAASVADQVAPGLSVEHLVQDSLSGPAVPEALAPFPQAKLVIEKDKGMYDAINRGWARAAGDIFCWLNCDEQYQPGVLAQVAAYFRDHPETEILFADAVVVDGEGRYRCSRQVLAPHLYHTWISHLSTWSCATFFRSHLITEKGFRLDTRWRAAGDAALIIAMLKAGVRMDVLRQYASIFVVTGENLGQQPEAAAEHRALAGEAPGWARAVGPLWKALHRLRRLAHGFYWPQPFSYEIYTPSSPRTRVRFEVDHPTFRWQSLM